MPRFLTAGLAVLALACTPALWALDAPPEAKVKQTPKPQHSAAMTLSDVGQMARARQTPKQQYQAVLDEYQKAMQSFSQAYSKAKTQEERNKLFQEKYPDRGKYSERFLAIAEKHIDDPAGIDALVWALQLGVTPQGARAKVVGELLIKNAANPKIGRVTSLLAYSYAPWAEGVLRTIAEKNPDRTARGQATMSLAQFLNRRIELVRTFKDDPKRAEQMALSLTAQGFDKDAINKLKTTDPDALAKEAEGLFEKIVKDYNDVASGRGTLGKTAQGELNEIRNLGIGKPCPEISGDDIEGKSFKLSDYKGKVVVVDFWGDW